MSLRGKLIMECMTCHSLTCSKQPPQLANNRSPIVHSCKAYCNSRVHLRIPRDSARSNCTDCTLDKLCLECTGDACIHNKRSIAFTANTPQFRSQELKLKLRAHKGQMPYANKERNLFCNSFLRHRNHIQPAAIAFDLRSLHATNRPKNGGFGGCYIKQALEADKNFMGHYN